MHVTHRQEQFSNAFLLAVAAAAGCSAAKPSVDNDSIDWTLSNTMRRRPKLDVQLKCTSLQVNEDGFFHYALKKKNYDDLIIEVSSPRILVLVIVPEEIGHWMKQTNDELILRRCAYWRSLAGMPMNDNENSVTVTVSAANLLTVESLNQIMEKINAGVAL
jgi:hypothetical protein